MGVVAIPTGIISAGFVEQYQKLKQKGDYEEEERLRVIRVKLSAGDDWAGRTISELALPGRAMVAAVFRDGRRIPPKGSVILKTGDILVIGAQISTDEPVENLREVSIGAGHPFCGEAIRDLDISRQSYVAMVRRGAEILTPKEDLVLQKGDTVFILDRPGRKRLLEG